MDSWLTRALPRFQLISFCVDLIYRHTKKVVNHTYKEEKGQCVTLQYPWENGKGSVSPSDVNILDIVSVYRTFMALIIFVGIPYKPRISNILSRSTESKALEKSTKTIARSLLQACDSSMSRLIHKIWLRVDLPLLKQVWLFLRSGSMEGTSRLRIILLYILAAIGINDMPL